MWTRETVERHSVDLRQFIDFRQSVLPGGQRVVEAYNSSGLTLTLLPDRGLDIWLATCNGLPLTWIAQNSPFPGDAGSSWLRQFNGGLLTTCGLTHAGPPETDPDTGERRDLHGRYTYQRAGNLAVAGQWTAVGGQEKYILELKGVIAESVLFGEQLRLERTYRLILGEPMVEIVDTVQNRGDLPAPFMLLYHCNVGYPLVAAGSRLHVAGERAYARDAVAAPGLGRWADYDAASPRYAEQVFFHRVKAGSDGWTEVALMRGDIGLSFSWDTAALPYLTQWKNTREGVYVCGVEPGNCLPEGRNAARENDRLQTLQPGETARSTLRLAPLSGADAVAACQARIEALQAAGRPVENCSLDDFAHWG